MLKVEQLTKFYATPQGRLHAVKRISFEVPQGAFFTLLGPSGCGKTTTLRCLAGLEEPDDGRISIGGKVMADPGANHYHVPPYRRDIGMVFQSYAIWPHMDVFENVAYPLRVRKPRPPRDEIRERVLHALRQVGMEEMADRPATRLSGGQQQRVAFARALVREPKLLLLDEITEGLAPVIVQRLGQIVTALREKGFTVVLVEQNFRFAAPLADRHYVVERGQVVKVVEKNELEIGRAHV